MYTLRLKYKWTTQRKDIICEIKPNNDIKHPIVNQVILN